MDEEPLAVRFHIFNMSYLRINQVPAKEKPQISIMASAFSSPESFISVFCQYDSVLNPCSGPTLVMFFTMIFLC